VVNNTTGCKTAIQFNLSVNPLPRAAAPASLTKCGTPAGTASFNLTSQDAAILNGQDSANLVVKYYSDADAQNVITTPEGFTSAGQVVYAVVSNAATGCTSNIIAFNLEVTEASFFTEALQFTGCPPYNLGGIVTGLEEGLTLTYFASQQDAENNSNAIANPDMYNSSDKEILLYVRAQNADGCIDITQLVLQQDDCSIPKGISPNGDNKNDRFELSALNVAYLGIYNRFGQEVYSQSNYTNQWHGQTSNNNELPTGTYYFMVQRADGRSETGWVYINREE
jgi:gliding motility-associated-like protein